jgi:hypothetical protein
LRAQQENLDFRDGHAPGAAIRGHDADRLVTGHSQHGGILLLLAPGAQIQGAA